LCAAWEDYKVFWLWANTHGYDKVLTIDRKDVTLGYSPENCRWVDQLTQANNTSRNRFVTIEHTTLTVSQWQRELGFCSATFSAYAKKGMLESIAMLRATQIHLAKN
jgi:hypothetical protein